MSLNYQEGKLVNFITPQKKKKTIKEEITNNSSNFILENREKIILWRKQYKNQLFQKLKLLRNTYLTPTPPHVQALTVNTKWRTCKHKRRNWGARLESKTSDNMLGNPFCPKLKLIQNQPNNVFKLTPTSIFVSIMWLND